MRHGIPHRGSLVDAHKRNPVGDFIVYRYDRCLQAFQKFRIRCAFIDRGEDDPIHPVGGQPHQLVLLKFAVVVMQGDIDIVTVLCRFPLDRTQHSCKIPVAHIHDHDSDIVGPALHQPPRQQIRPVIMFLRDAQDHLLRIRMNSPSSVKCAVHGRARYAAQLRQILCRDSHDASPSFVYFSSVKAKRPNRYYFFLLQTIP